MPYVNGLKDKSNIIEIEKARLSSLLSKGVRLKYLDTYLDKIKKLIVSESIDCSLPEIALYGVVNYIKTKTNWGLGDTKEIDKWVLGALLKILSGKENIKA